MKNLVTFLKTIPILKSLKEDQLKKLAVKSVLDNYEVGSTIFSKGDPSDRFHIVYSGRVKILTRSAAKMRAAFAYLGPKDFFGEMAIIGASPRSASVEAMEYSEILSIPKDDIRALLETNPLFACDFLAILSSRLREADEKIEGLLFNNILGRLAKVLFNIARKEGEDVGNGILIQKRITRQEMADMVGTTREPLTRALSTLQKAEVLRIRKDGIFLNDLKRLEALAGEPARGRR